MADISCKRIVLTPNIQNPAEYVTAEERYIHAMSKCNEKMDAIAINTATKHIL